MFKRVMGMVVALCILIIPCTTSATEEPLWMGTANSFLVEYMYNLMAYDASASFMDSYISYENDVFYEGIIVRIGEYKVDLLLTYDDLLQVTSISMQLPANGMELAAMELLESIKSGSKPDSSELDSIMAVISSLSKTLDRNKATTEESDTFSTLFLRTVIAIIDNKAMYADKVNGSAALIRALDKDPIKIQVLVSNEIDSVGR